MYLATALPEAWSVQLGVRRSSYPCSRVTTRSGLRTASVIHGHFDLRHSRASMIRDAPRGCCSEGLSASLCWEISTSGNSNKTDS